MTSFTPQLVDNFNRANENPLSNNSKWSATTPAATVGLKTVSNQAVRQAATGTFGRNGSFRNDVTVGAGQSCAAWHTVGNAGSDGEIDVGVFNSTSTVGYYLASHVGTFGTDHELIRYDTGYVTAVIAAYSSRALTTNDREAIWIDGTDIVGLLDTGSGFAEILRVQDTTYRPAWTFYWEIAGFNDVTSAAIDDVTVALVSQPILPSDVPFVYMRKNV